MWGALFSLRDPLRQPTRKTSEKGNPPKTRAVTVISLTNNSKSRIKWSLSYFTVDLSQCCFAKVRPTKCMKQRLALNRALSSRRVQNCGTGLAIDKVQIFLLNLQSEATLAFSEFHAVPFLMYTVIV